MPSQSYQHSTIAGAPAVEVWAALDHPKSWELIPGVDRVIDPVVDHEGRLRGFDFESRVAGKAYRGRATPAGREEGKMIAWEITTPELEGKVMVALDGHDDGTRVYVTLRVQSVGMLGSLFFGVISNSIGDGFAATVEEFAAGLAAD